jgi:site-specific DNA-cytosine methylase
MRILDLYCGAGGAGTGYNRAGFEVVGIDIKSQPNYPFAFSQMGALEALQILIDGGSILTTKGYFKLEDFDFIHASPPCQSSSALTKGTNFGKFEYPDFIAETRRLLHKTGLPYVIENVAGAQIEKDLMLCGEMFGLAVIRHRFFEFSVDCFIDQPAHPKHRGRVAGMRHGVWYEGPYFAVYGDGGGKGSVPQWQDAMDMHWTNVRKEIAEAIPPAYSEYIGRQLQVVLGKP